MEKAACRINGEFKNISFLLDPIIIFVLILGSEQKKIQLGLINKGIELGNSNYRETKSNELSFFHSNDFPI